jgi:hypothetical protein
MSEPIVAIRFYRLSNHSKCSPGNVVEISHTIDPLASKKSLWELAAVFSRLL